MLTDEEVGVGFEQDVFIKNITRLCHKVAQHRHEMFVDFKQCQCDIHVHIHHESIYFSLFVSEMHKVLSNYVNMSWQRSLWFRVPLN